MMPDDEARVYTIRWSDLARWKKKGLKMIQIMPGPGAETTALAIVPEELVDELAKQSKSRRKPSLREILVDLVEWAAFKPGDVKRTRLSGGMGIDVIWGIDGMWRLQIWREGVQPSLKEWETVLKSWPEPVPQIEYKRFTHNGKQYIRGEWKNEPIQENIPGADDAAAESGHGSDGSDRNV